jgi:hypothetical protein
VDGRSLTSGEIELCRSIFGSAIDYSNVQLIQRKWWPLQPINYVMTPSGNLHFHPKSWLWSDDFSIAQTHVDLFIHEMTHVWQSQKWGRFYLLLQRHPFCRYDYSVRPGQRFEQYGLEQQAEIVRHVFLLRHRQPLAGAPPLEQLESILPREWKT